MTATTGHPPEVARALEDAALTALDANLRRYRASRRDTWGLSLIMPNTADRRRQQLDAMTVQAVARACGSLTTLAGESDADRSA